MFASQGRGVWISWYVREHRLYALTVAQLSVGWLGQFTRGDIKHPTIILEVIDFYDRWIWHSFFGVVDSNNDINVLNQSPLFVDVIRGHTPKVSFIVNDREHHMRYYLTDGIYPS
jgi:hypothetical protein